MSKRIMLVHAFLPSMAPTVTAFRAGWPEAEVLNLVDESVYADVTPEGVMKPGVAERVTSLLNQAVQGGAAGIVFTGSTFGPAVDKARQAIAVPVLKADEAMAEQAVTQGRRILIACTAARAVPVVRANMEAAAQQAGKQPLIDGFAVPGAKAAIAAGDDALHDRLIADWVEKNHHDYDVIALGQISMVPSRELLSPGAAAKVICSPDATVARMRALLDIR